MIPTGNPTERNAARVGFGSDVELVTDFPQFRYSMGEVRRAGKALKGDIIWTEDGADDIKEIFRIANNWRDSHAYPMRRLRSELSGQIRRLKGSGITVARLKRMHSIRKKLRAISANLNHIQDLGGCRAILPTIRDAKLLINACRENLRHDRHKENDYINHPKPDGYRCHHIVFKFVGTEEATVFDGRRVEIQIRTRLQHSWATAVEAVGLFRNEDIKGGGGNPEWRRLFELMSSEFAIAECCPELPSAPTRAERIAEIKELDRRLKAANLLENLSQAFRYLDSYLSESSKYFLIKYNNIDATVDVVGYSTPISGTKSFNEAENNGGQINSVLVEADKIETLKEAYPNYFGDVQLFKSNLKSITRGKGAKEYTMPPQATVPPSPKEAPDTSWFRRHKRWN